MSVVQIHKRLDMLLEYMKPHWEYANCHMVNYLTEQHFNRFVPATMRAELSSEQHVRHCIEGIFWEQKNTENDMPQFTAFKQFLHSAQTHRLDRFTELLTSVEQLKQLLHFESTKERISIKEFMSEKKSHEVETTAELVDLLINQDLRTESTENVFVIDTGDGKGYLSSRLALQYGHKVLGLDANITNTENALKRGKKLQRVWNGLTTRAALESQGQKPSRRCKKSATLQNETQSAKTGISENYRTSNNFITSNLNILRMLQTHFPACFTNNQELPKICLTGLHTCGNLAPTCLRLFHNEIHCKVLLNVGCCYHLLKENFCGQEFFGNNKLVEAQSEYGFPMSDYLQQRQFKMGRNARMLASQSIERTLDTKELPNISLYYRALLEVLICEQKESLETNVRVGRLRKFDNFEDYVRRCKERIPLNIEKLSADRINELEKDYAEQRKYLDLFYLLRMSFAPILESIILLDRFLYLREMGYERSYLIPLFDAVISPRRFAIVALK